MSNCRIAIAATLACSLLAGLASGTASAQDQGKSWTYCSYNTLDKAYFSDIFITRFPPSTAAKEALDAAWKRHVEQGPAKGEDLSYAGGSCFRLTESKIGPGDFAPRPSVEEKARDKRKSEIGRARNYPKEVVIVDFKYR
ncbi:MAG: hypothetical protein RIC51_11735 [Erythrobacter sp.]|uniref:hypothetical protein n=1 Tax=Erythrobacter sp. TaxID=1042 RepID=UPI0032EF7B7D